MAISFVNSADLGALLKELQWNTMSDALNLESPFFNFIKKELKKVPPDGKGLRTPIKTKGGIAAVGSIGYSGSFKSQKQITVAELVARPKYHTAHIELLWSVVEAGKREVGAFIDPAKVEIKDKQSYLARDLARQSFGDGSGIIGEVYSVTDNGATGTIVIYDTSAKPGCIRWFEEEDTIKIYPVGGDTARVIDAGSATELVISAIDESANSITVAPASGNFDTGSVVQGDMIRRSGVTSSYAETDYAYKCEEMCGLESLIDASNTIFGISRTTHPKFKGTEVDCSAAPLDVSNLLKGIQEADRKGKGKIKKLFMYHDTYNRLADIAEEDKRIINSKDAVLGFDKLSFRSYHGPVEFECDQFCRADRIFGIDPEYIYLFGKDFDFMEDGGQILQKKPASGGGYSPSYVADLMGIMELYCVNPSGCLKIKNFTNS